MGSIAGKLFFNRNYLKIFYFNIHLLFQAGGAVPQILQTIDLKAVSTDRCKTIYDGQQLVHDSHICTLTKVGEGACNGDSGNLIPNYDLWKSCSKTFAKLFLKILRTGGPLVKDNKLVGIVNWGVP